MLQGFSKEGMDWRTISRGTCLVSSRHGRKNDSAKQLVRITLNIPPSIGTKGLSMARREVDPEAKSLLQLLAG